MIHFLTNQMQIKFNSMKKIEIRFGKFLVNLGPIIEDEARKMIEMSRDGAFTP